LFRNPAIVVGFAVALLALAPAPSVADFVGPVASVADGDTITVLHAGRPIRVRLEGIDAPEIKQAYGVAAKKYVQGAVHGQDVHVIDRGIDRYGRTLGEVHLATGSLNRLLLQDGFAWWYKRYSKDGSLGALEASARSRRAGLWADDAPVPPWEYRRRRLSADHRKLLRMFAPAMAVPASR